MKLTQKTVCQKSRKNGANESGSAKNSSAKQAPNVVRVMQILSPVMQMVKWSESTESNQKRLAINSYLSPRYLLIVTGHKENS